MGKGRTDSSSEAAKDLEGEPPPRSGVRPTMTEDSLVTDWTDEKHRLYINSMEVSFVSQLHSQKHFSSSLLSWLQKKRKLQNQRPELMSTSTSCSTGQFEILQEGSWKRLNFDDTEFQADVLGSQQDLLVNPWIRHFKSGSSSKGRRVTSAKLQGEYDGPIGELSEVVPHSSKSHFTQTSNHLSPMSVQKCFGNNSEASDQNFSEEEGEENNFIKGIHMEVPDSRNTEASAFDQVMGSKVSNTYCVVHLNTSIVLGPGYILHCNSLYSLVLVYAASIVQKKKRNRSLDHKPWCLIHVMKPHKGLPL